MKGNGLDVAAALRTIASEDTTVRVQLCPAKRELNIELCTWAARIVVLIPVSGLVTLSLGVLHAAGAPVPRLSYGATLLVLVSAHLLVALFRRPRWF